MRQIQRCALALMLLCLLLVEFGIGIKDNTTAGTGLILYIIGACVFIFGRQ